MTKAKEQYVKVNAQGMSFGRPRHEGGDGGYYAMGEVVAVNELRKWKYQKASMVEALANKTLLLVNEDGSVAEADLSKVAPTGGEEGDLNELMKKERDRKARRAAKLAEMERKKRELEDALVWEELEEEDEELAVEVEEEEDEELEEEELEEEEEETEDEEEAEELRRGLNYQQYWKKYGQKKCPTKGCGKKHRSRIDLWDCAA